MSQRHAERFHDLDALELDPVEFDGPSPGKSSAAHLAYAHVPAPPSAAPLDWGAALLAARDAGTPESLPSDLRRDLEAHSDADLSGVRIHTGGDSSTATRSMGALACAVGQDIHFAAGQYDPGSASGRHLIAHEVAHTIQQRGAGPVAQANLEVGQPADAGESQADRFADTFLAGEPAPRLATAASVRVQRKESAPHAPPAAQAQPRPPNQFLLNAVRDNLMLTFNAMRTGVNAVITSLVEPSVPRSAPWQALVEIAMQGVIAGIAGGAGGAAGRVASSVIPNVASDAIAEMTESIVSDSLRKGASSESTDLAGNDRDERGEEAPALGTEGIITAPVTAHRRTPMSYFGERMHAHIDNSEGRAASLYWERVAPLLAHLEDRTLIRIAAALRAPAYTDTIVELVRLRTVVAWTNFLAQLHNGAMAGTENINPASAQSLVNVKRQYLKDTHGVLIVELHAWDGGSWTSLHGMHVHGIPDAFKADLRSFTLVRDVPVNKLVRVYLGRYDKRFAPQADLSILVTADGRIGRVDRTSEAIGALDISSMAATAGLMPMSNLR